MPVPFPGMRERAAARGRLGLRKKRTRRERVVVVTDSTASLSPEMAHEAGIVVVPLHVLVGEDDLDDDAGARAAVATRLRAGGTATTAQVTPDAFARVYADLADGGAAAIVSVHLAAGLSGTVRSAEEAALTAAVPVGVVDSRNVALGTGFAALAAARAAAAGAGLAEVVEAARTVAAAATTVFAVQDLGHLRRGGRISAAQAFVASVLGARPLLRVRDGAIGVAETVRGEARAARRLVTLAVEAAVGLAPGAVHVAVHHFDAEAAGRDLADRLGQALAQAGVDVDGGAPLLAEVTAVVGVHAGPGVLGIVVAPAVRAAG